MRVPKWAALRIGKGPALWRPQEMPGEVCWLNPTLSRRQTSGQRAEGRCGCVVGTTWIIGAIAGGFAGLYWMGWMRERAGGYAGGIGWLPARCPLAAACMWGWIRGVKVDEDDWLVMFAFEESE